MNYLLDKYNEKINFRVIISFLDYFIKIRLFDTDKKYNFHIKIK